MSELLHESETLKVYFHPEIIDEKHRFHCIICETALIYMQDLVKTATEKPEGGIIKL